MHVEGISLDVPNIIPAASIISSSSSDGPRPGMLSRGQER